MTDLPNPSASSKSGTIPASLIGIATDKLARLGLADSLGQAASLMVERGISSVVVSDEVGHPQGIVTERDVLRAMLQGSSQTTALQSFMSAPVVTVPQSTGIHDAWQIALRQRVRHLVLVDEDGGLAGILDEYDLRLLQNHSQLEAERDNELILLRTMLNTLPDPVWLKDAEGHFLACNRRFAQILGVSETEILGKTDYDFLASALADDFHKHDIKIIETGVSSVKEETLNFAGLDYEGVFETTKTPIRDGDGRIVGVLGVAHDITGRKRLEQTLSASEQFKQGVLDSLTAHLAVINSEGIVQAINRPWQQFALENGNPNAGQVGIGANYLDVCRRAADSGDPLAQTFLQGLEAVLAGEIPRFEQEYPCDSPTEKRWYSAHVLKPFADAGGAVITHLEITERKQAEQRERSRADLLEAIACGVSLPDLLDRLSRSIEEQVPGSFCSILLLDETGQKLIRMAAPSLPAFYVEAIDSIPVGPGKGSCGAAVYEGRRIIIKDVQNHPYWADYKDMASQAGINACWAEPIIGSQGQKLGVFAIYWRQQQSPNEQEIEILTYASHMASIAIERRAMEKKLAESETHFRNLADSGQALIWTAGLDKKCNYFNRVWLDFTGRTLAQEMGDGWLEGVHPDDMERCIHTYMEAFDRREAFSMDYRMRRYDGVYRWIQDDGTPRYDCQGEFIGYIGHCLDIEDRKQDELRLRELSQAMDQAADGIALSDLSGNIRYTNKAWASMHGYTPEELIGKPLSIFHTEEQLRTEVGPHLAQLKQNKANFGEVEHVRRDGTCFPTWMTTSLLIDGEQQAAGMVGVARDITEIKQAQRELEEGQARLQKILEKMPIPICYVNQASAVYFRNESFEKLFGYTMEDVPTMAEWWLKAYPDPDYRQAVLENWQADVDYSTTHGVEIPSRQYEVTCKNGNQRVVEISGIGFGEDFLATIIDLTAYKAAEAELERHKQNLELQVEQRMAALKSSEQRFRTLADLSPSGIWLTDPEGQALYFSTRWCEITGLSPSQAISNWTLAIHPDDRPRVLEEWQRAAPLEEEFSSELRFLRPDGEVVWVLGVGRVERDLDGHKLGWIGTITDITVIRNQAEMLREERRRLRDIIDGTRIGTWEWNIQTGTLILNERWAEIVGYTLEELQPISIETWMRLAHPDDLRASDALLKRVFARELDFYEDEVRLRHKNGDWVWVMDRGKVIEWSADGRPLLMSGTHQDITERKQDELALVQASTEAQAASQAKSDFVANMSHEIRTPMNAVLGFCYLLEQKKLSPAERELVAKIRIAGDSLLHIINDILDFSKIDAGRMDIESAPFRLADILDKLAGIMSATIGTKPIEFEIAPPVDGVEYLKGDAMRLEQILTNLASNAVKFTERGKITVESRLLRAEGERVELRFSVRDTGIGIEPDKLGHIFSAFAQADGSMTRRFGGTGLGLSICQHLVALMGGEIGVRSEPGAGSEFWFTLPFQVLSQKDFLMDARQHQRVLVADDNRLARHTLKGIVRNLGWQVESVETGIEAVERFDSALMAGKPFDIVLMDWHMPGLDGLAASHAIRGRCQGLPEPLIILVTAHDEGQFTRDDGQFTNMADEKVDAVLSKGVKASTLYNTIINLQAQKQSLHRPPSPAGKHLDGLTILVADDNDINLEVAYLNLKAEGATVYLVADGQEALNWLAGHADEVDVVLMDVQMPVMDGYQATLQIRQTLGLMDLPIIALSAGAFKSEQDAALASGMNGFIAKPFNMPKVIDTIARLTGLTAQSGHPDARPPISPMAEITTAKVLDAERGLSVWKSEANYHKYLRHFAEGYAHADEEVCRLVEDGKPQDAASLAHKLRGSAGNLALFELERSAEQVEKTLDNNQDASEPIRQLQVALARALEAIEGLVEPARRQTQTPSVEPAQLAALLNDLLHALDQDAPDGAETILSLLAEMLPENWLTDIIKAVDEFDFLEAETHTHTLAKRLGVHLGN